MTLVKAVVDKVAPNGTIDSTRDEQILASTVTRWGTRTVDEGEFKFSINTDIEMNDNLRYIQDIVSVELLTAIYNFQLTTFDEGGYSHNPVTDLPVTRFIAPNIGVNDMKFQSQYVLKFDAVGQEYDIPDDSRLDFSKQFDIYIWCETNLPHFGTFASDGDRQIIFSKYDAAGNGIEIGAIIRPNPVLEDPYVYARVIQGTVVTELEGTPDGSVDNLFSSGKPNLIRLYRDENNVIRLELNGRLDADSIATVTGSLDNALDITIGSDNAGTLDWDGFIAQLRIYNGSYLTEAEAEVIYLNSPQPLTMKLAGQVSKVNDNTNPKKIVVRGNGRVLIDTNITSDVLTGTDTNPDRTGNVYDEAEVNLDILEDIIANVDSSFVFKNGSSDMSAHIGKFIATGSFLQCAELLLLEGAQILFTNNKNIIVENDSGVSTPFKFEQGDTATTPGFVITASAEDDSLLVNQLELLGRLNNVYTESGFGSGDSEKALVAVPITMRVEAPVGTVLVEGSDFFIDYEIPEVTFNPTSPAAGTVFYNYEDVISSRALYFRNITTGSGSVTRYGKYDRRIFIPQLTKQEDFDQASTRIIQDNDEVLIRYEVRAPNHCNHIRENHNVLIVNSIKGISTTETVKSISWTYPQMKTIIHLGEHRFDSFDMEKVDAQSNIQGEGSTFKTHNS